MEILKLLNNSSAVIQDGSHEKIVMGKGIGFGKKVGDIIDDTRIEKVYSLANILSLDKIQLFFEKISYQDSKLAFDLVERFREELDYELNDIIYLSLADHISFALQRAKKSFPIENIVLHEVQMFYPKEHALGQWAVKKIQNERGITLDHDEAGFIALHIINARWQSSEKTNISEISKIIDDLVVILTNEYKIDFRNDNVNYNRLITHLKYLLFRYFNITDRCLNEFKDFDNVKKLFPDAYNGTQKINEYFSTFLKKKISQEEKVYLTIHINRFLSN